MKGAYLAAVWHENNMAAMFCHLNVKGATLVSRRNAGQILSLTIKKNLVGIAFAEVVKEGERSTRCYGGLSQNK